MNQSTLRLLVLYVLCVGIQQLLKNVIPLDKNVQFVLVMYTPPVLWLVVAIIKNGHKY